MRFHRLLFPFFLSLPLLARAAALPDLAQLKMGAEMGDAVAQFEYGQRISSDEDETERMKWIRRSAEQGYAPAQNDLSSHCASRAGFDPQKRRSWEREAVRWASKAAYQGYYEAQLKLGRFYERGFGVMKDPVTAYMWMEIAVQAQQGKSDTLDGSTAKSERDRLVTLINSDQIKEGRRRASAFVPAHFPGLNPVEADLIFSQLKLSAIFQLKEHSSAVVNDVRFIAGETKEMIIDDAVVRLTCVSVEARSAHFAVEGTTGETALALKH